MILLSRFGTILCADMAKGLLVQAPIRVVAADAAQPLPLRIPHWPSAPTQLATLPGLIIQPGIDSGQIYICRDEYDLCVHPTKPAAFLRHQREGRFPYLLVDETALQGLRTILSQRWAFQSGYVGTPVLLDPFTLDFGQVTVDLIHGIPKSASDAEDVFVLSTEDGDVTIQPAGELPREILLRRRGAGWSARYVSTVQELHTTPDARLTVKAETEMLALPITVCAEDYAWLHDKAYGDFPQITGRHRCQPSIAHESNKFVMMARYTEGNTFDDYDFSTEFGFCNGLGEGGGRHLPMPAGMRCEGERLFIDRTVLDSAPRLAGPHIVFTTPQLSNYYHWLVDAILPLTVLLRYAPADAKILLPATLRDFLGGRERTCDHHDILREAGLRDHAFAEFSGPYVQVQDVYFLENGFMHNLHAECLQDFRSHIVRRRPTVQRNRNLYIKRRYMRTISNAAALERFLGERDFTTHTLEDLSFDQQVDLFSRATFVVATHGAGLANLLFCAPGTKVLELSPDIEFRPFFSYMSSKLGLTHGILPCRTSNGGFHGDLMVPMQKLGALFRMLKNHL
jgi:hypothetical protein